MEQIRLDPLLVVPPMKMVPTDKRMIRDVGISREQIHVMVKKETLTYFRSTISSSPAPVESNCLPLETLSSSSISPADSMMLSSNGSCSCRQAGQVDPATTTRGKNELDSVYHLRMSDWSYRIVDCFGVSREIVAISFDYLNRFIASNVLPW